jgi:hypothetical protein
MFIRGLGHSPALRLARAWRIAGSPTFARRVAGHAKWRVPSRTGQCAGAMLNALLNRARPERTTVTDMRSYSEPWLNELREQFVAAGHDHQRIDRHIEESMVRYRDRRSQAVVPLLIERYVSRALRDELPPY